jgi:APA family basic amino acid/polyamine antiporter
VNWIATVINCFIISFVIIAGLAHADARNLTENFNPFGVRGIFSAASVLFFAYLGFDAVSTMAEEVKDPARDIPIGLIGSMSICTFIYMMMALTLSLMVPYTQIDEGAPFSVAFASVGWTWAKYVVAIGALKGITTVLLVSAVGQARYLAHIARAHLIPPWFARVNSKTQTPINATSTMIVASSIVGFFTELPILGNLLSMSSLFIFFLVAVALLVRRYYVPGETTTRHGALFGVYLAVIVGASVVIAAFWGMNGKGYVVYAICGPVWFVATLAMHVTLRQLRRPKTWGVPLVPWLPSLSIAFNVFLLGSLDRASFVRFGYWTAIMLVYYFFFGLHASFDAATEVVAPKRVSDAEALTATGDGAVTGPTAALVPHAQE